MKKRFCLLIALLLSLGLSCAAEPILESTPFLLEAEELLELIDQYQQVPSIALGEEAALNLLKDAELILGAEPTPEEAILDTEPAEVKTILDTGAVITLADRAALNVHGALRGWIADIVLGEESEINVFFSSGALMDALLPEELVEPEKLEALKASFTYYGLNISDLGNPNSIAVFDASGNRIHFGSGDKTDNIVYPGERYTVLFRTGLNKGRRLSFELDPSVPLSLTELLAQNPITAKLQLEATDVAEGADVPFTATLSRAARRKAVVTLRVGEADYTIDIPAGAISGSVLVANPNGEDPYIDAGTLTATVTGFSGGGFDRVYYRDVSATANISDTIDTTAVSLSATDADEGNAYVSFTLGLSNPAQTAATATVNVGGKSYNVSIPAGASSVALSVSNPNTEDVYLDASTLTANVTGFIGGGFEKVDYSKATATATIADTIDTTAVSLSAADADEGNAYVSFTLGLSNPAQTAATATVNVGGKSYNVSIPAGASSVALSVSNPNTEDVYLDASTLTANVTGFSGGSFEKVDYSNATATANIADTIDTTTVTLSATDGKEGDANVRFTVSLSNPAQTAATVTVKANGKSHTVTIPAGKSSGTLDVPNPNTEDVYLDASTLTATVTAFSGGNFEQVDFSKASATANISDTIDTTRVSLSAADADEGNAYVSFTLGLSNPAQTAATVTVKANGKSYSVTIPAGKSSATLSVPNPNAEDVYLDASALTASVTGFSGGNFEQVDYSNATATANISDTVDTTAVTLSAADGKEGDANISFTVTLDNAARTAATATVQANGKSHTVTIPAGKSSGTVSVPNPYADDAYLGARTLTGSVTAFSGGSFEQVDYSGASATANIADTIDTTTVSLFATDGKEGDANIRFTATLSNESQTDATVTVNVGGTGYTVNIPAGATGGSVNVPNPNGEDVYLDASTLTATVTGFTGGDFEKVDFSKASATAIISDTVNTTKVSLSARDYMETDKYVTFTVTLSNPAQSAATVTVNVGSANYSVNIAPGATSGSVNVPINGAASLTGTVTGLTGGNFEAVDYSGATATAKNSDTINTTTKVSLSASNYGPTDTHATFTVTLSNPAQSAALGTVNVGGNDLSVYIAAGATSGSVNVPINGATSLTGTVTGLTGDNLETADYTGATATARLHYTTTVSISVNDIVESDPYIYFTIYLSNAPTTSATAKVKVGDTNQTVTIASGQRSAFFSVIKPPSSETYTLSAEVTSISGGGFTSVDCSGAKTTVSITPVPSD